MEKLAIVLFLFGISVWGKSPVFCSEKSLLDGNGPYPISVSPNEIGTIKKHQFIFKNKGKTTALTYHIAEALSEPKKGTLIYLCGGPGFPCIKRPFNFPEDYDIVTIPYLGVGDNRVLNTPTEMAIDSQGEAVAQLINDLSRSDIIILGHSYGTAVGTVAASKYSHKSKAERKSTIKGIFLTGVVGPSAGETYGRDYPDVANQAWQLLREADRKKFQTEYKKLSRTLSKDKKQKLDRMLTSQLIYGPKKTAEWLEAFIDSPKDFTPIASPKKIQPEIKEGIWQQRAAACELFEKVADFKNVKVFDNLVTPEAFSPEICECRLLNAGWDPAQYQIRDIPILYLNGNSDPATPTKGARKHFEGQHETKNKIFLAEPNAGHGEFIISGAHTNSCMPTLLENLANGSLTEIEKNQDRYFKNGCNPQKPESASGQQTR